MSDQVPPENLGHTFHMHAIYDFMDDTLLAREVYGILGFSTKEIDAIYKIASAVKRRMGNPTKDFVQVGEGNQAEIMDDTNAQMVANFCGVGRGMYIFMVLYEKCVQC